jgi:CBS domain-containing protein
MSPRAAWRLERMGFAEVYDYAAGKQDWTSAGLPTEGSEAAKPRAGTVARADVPTALPEEPFEEVRRRVEAAGWDAVVVVNEEGIVFGLLRAEQLAAEGDGPVERFMRPNPSTFRPNVPIAEMAQYMVDHDLVSCPITTNEGRLVGLLRREDAARAALDLHEREHHR